MTNIAMSIKSLSYSDQILAEQIIAGCEQFVENMEAQWYGRRVRHPKISERQLVQLSALSQSNSNGGFRPFPEINSRLRKNANATMDPATVYRALGPLVNVNYYEKINFGKSKRPRFTGRNVQYKNTKKLFAFNEVISRPNPRGIIYNKLVQSGILERYHRVCRYRDLLMYKKVDVELRLLGRSARGILEEQERVDSYKEEYLKTQKLLKNKSNREIFLAACKLARMDLQNKPIEDRTYTNFFIGGGISYKELEFEPYRK